MLSEPEVISLNAKLQEFVGYGNYHGDMFRDDLFQFALEASSVPKGLPLVAGLTGFADAGGAVTQVNKYVFDTLDYERVGAFSNDNLIDYRARRPV
jgi:hypothetical protein